MQKCNAVVTFVCLVVLQYFPSESTGAPLSPGKIRAMAEDALVKRDYGKAEKLLGEVIVMEPESGQNYFKRARVYQRQLKHLKAVRDLQSAVEFKANYLQAQVALGKLLRKTGKCGAAVAALAGALQSASVIEKVAKRERETKKVAAETGIATKCQSLTTKVESVLGTEVADLTLPFKASKKNLEIASEALADIIQETPYATGLFMARAMVLQQLEQFWDVVAITGKILKVQRDSIPALLLRANGYYRLADHKMAMQHIREGLKLDPEHKGCKALYRVMKKLDRFHAKGQAAFEKQEWQEAVEHLQRSIDADPTHREHAKTCAVRQSEALLRLKQYKEAMDKASEAIRLDPSVAMHHIRLGEALLGLEEFDAAVRAMSKAKELEPKDQEVHNHLNKAKTALKQSKEVNYYKVLGVPRDATQREIKKAYRKLAMKLHPDRIEKEEDKEKAEEEFQKVALANEILTDEETRAKYDRGEDVLNNQGGGGRGPGRGFPFHMFQRGGGGRRFSFKMG